MSNPEAATPTPNADATAIATLLLSRGKYFIGSKFDTTITPDEGEGPYVAPTPASCATARPTTFTSW